MKKKFPISLKLFISFSIITLFIIFLIYILNTTVLEIYYLNYKKQFLAKTYTTLENTYSSTSDDTVSSEIEDIEANKNVDIVIRDNNNITIYSTAKDFSSNVMFPLSNVQDQIDNEFIEEKLSENKKYFIVTVRDKRLHNDFVTLFGRLSNGYTVTIRTPLETIKESVTVTNSFLFIVGTISIALSSLIAYILSKRFSKPITELDAIAQKMSQFDFSKKYYSASNDEIATLGTSINTLSNNLEAKINELSEINLELEKDVEEKSKLAEMRSQFVSDVSHELKTPIALIQGYAEGLVDGIASTDEDKKYYLEVILDEANKMSALTHDLLDLSNLEYGKNSLNIENFNIIDLISNVLKKDEIIFSEKNITCSFMHQSNELLVSGDVFRIEQVLTNYINNAIKNVDENNIIKIGIDVNDDVAKVSVYNSGKGIDKENLARIWTKFFKADPSRNRDLSGSGIGLSLVKAIMDQHKNNYGVKNVENGVEFWFELNLATNNN